MQEKKSDVKTQLVPYNLGKYLPTTPIPRFLSAIYPTYLPTTPSG